MQAQVTTPKGDKLSLNGFLASAARSCAQLDGEALATLARTDELELLYLQLHSMRNFNDVKDRLIGTLKEDAARRHGAGRRDRAVTPSAAWQPRPLGPRRRMPAADAQHRPVYSIADEQRARAESAAWARFTARRRRARAVRRLAGADGSAHRARARGDPAHPRARQPDLHGGGGLARPAPRPAVPGPGRRSRCSSAARASSRRRRRRRAGGRRRGPCGLSDRSRRAAAGAVVFDIGPGAVAALQDALRQIHWGSAWLIDHFRQWLLQRARGASSRVRRCSTRSWPRRCSTRACSRRRWPSSTNWRRACTATASRSASRRPARSRRW